MHHRTPILASFASAAVLIASVSCAEPPKPEPKPDAPKQEAPKQETPKQAPPKFEIDVPKDPLETGKRPDAPARPGGLAVADVIDPAAYAIAQRAMKVAAELRTIQLVTSARLEGGDLTNIPAGYGTPHEVTLEYRNKDAISLPRMRISPVSSNGVVVFTHDGAAGLVVDTNAKVFRYSKTGWTTLAPFALGALPSWITIERQLAASQGKKSSEIELRPVLVAASILRVETVDGVECDVVRSVKTRDLFADDVGGGKPGVIDVQRIVQEIAYARADGFPRRIVQFVEGAPEGSQRSTIEYSRVKVNPALDAGTFDVKPPEGYSNLATATPPATPPAGAAK